MKKIITALAILCAGTAFAADQNPDVSNPHKTSWMQRHNAMDRAEQNKMARLNRGPADNIVHREGKPDVYYHAVPVTYRSEWAHRKEMVNMKTQYVN